jgi:hypothetical protein
LRRCAFAGGAFADWQGVVWNSSPEQVDKAFLVPHRTPTQAEFQNYFGEVPIAFDDYQVGDLGVPQRASEFTGWKAVPNLDEPEDPFQCEKLITVLQAAYGKPAKDESPSWTNTSPSHYATWYDQKENNLFETTEFGR